MKERKSSQPTSSIEAGLASDVPPCCQVDALVSVDSRGQIVLPKEIRKKAGIETGDKLAVVSFESEGKVHCVSLIKADAFAGMVKKVLGPMMTEILEG